MIIHWHRIDQEAPEERRPLLLCQDYTQEAQVGWWEGGLLFRWHAGEPEFVRFGPTHWAYIEFPPCSDPISTWDKAFLVWENERARRVETPPNLTQEPKQ